MTNILTYANTVSDHLENARYFMCLYSLCCSSARPLLQQHELWALWRVHQLAVREEDRMSMSIVLRGHWLQGMEFTRRANVNHMWSGRLWHLIGHFVENYSKSAQKVQFWREKSHCKVRICLVSTRLRTFSHLNFIYDKHLIMLF